MHATIRLEFVPNRVLASPFKLQDFGTYDAIGWFDCGCCLGDGRRTGLRCVFEAMNAKRIECEVLCFMGARLLTRGGQILQRWALPAASSVGVLVIHKSIMQMIELPFSD